MWPYEIVPGAAGHHGHETLCCDGCSACFLCLACHREVCLPLVPFVSILTQLVRLIHPELQLQPTQPTCVRIITTRRLFDVSGATSAFSAEDLAAGRAKLVSFDHVMTLEGELKEVVMQLGLGWAFTLRHVHYRKASTPHDLEANLVRTRGLADVGVAGLHACSIRLAHSLLVHGLCMLSCVTA